jgi:hypothetical protein
MAASSSRVLWRVLAALLMLVGAYAAFAWMGTAATISGWIGLEKHQSEIPSLQRHATQLLWLALCMPFVSALLLHLARPERTASSGVDAAGMFGAITVYGKNLMFAAAATLTFALLLFLIGWIVFRFGHRA